MSARPVPGPRCCLNSTIIRDTKLQYKHKSIGETKRLLCNLLRMLNENRIETLPGMAFAGNPDIEVL